MEKVFQFLDGEVSEELDVVDEPVVGGDEKDFDGVECLGGPDGYGIGVDSEGMAFAIESKGPEDGDEVLFKEIQQ